jgi:outer membrane immunogenic protein
MLKKLIFALASIPGVAFAADLPTRYQMPLKAIAAVPFSWTGFYIGANVGGAFDNTDRVVAAGITPLLGIGPDPVTLRNKSDGISAGAQAGYNYEFALGNGNGVVIGLETDIAYTDLSSEMLIDAGVVVPGSSVDYRSRLNYLGTIRGRLGYAYDRFMVYGTGGFAYGSVDHSANLVLGGASLASASVTDTEIGFAYGGGVEYALPANAFFHLTETSAVTVRAEYLRYDLDHTSASINIPGSINVSLHDVGNIARAGVNYKF